MAAEFREDEMNSENSQSSLLNRAISNESMSNSTTEKEDVVTDQRSIHLILEGCNSKEGLNFEVNLQPEKIVEVFNLPVCINSNYSNFNKSNILFAFKRYLTIKLYQT